MCSVDSYHWVPLGQLSSMNSGHAISHSRGEPTRPGRAGRVLLHWNGGPGPALQYRGDHPPRLLSLITTNGEPAVASHNIQ